MSKAVIFFAPGLEECEGLLCVDILRRAGVEVTIAAVGGEKIVKSARQISVVADALAEELDYTVFDACILPGGIVCAGACPHPGRCRRRQQGQERDRVSVIYRSASPRPAGACGHREAPAGGQCPPLQPYNKTPCLFQDRALLWRGT